MGVGGKAIPPYIDKITDIQSDAEFIILVRREQNKTTFYPDATI
jgi:meiotic recombination protein SPO11